MRSPKTVGTRDPLNVHPERMRIDLASVRFLRDPDRMQFGTRRVRRADRDAGVPYVRRCDDDVDERVFGCALPVASNEVVQMTRSRDHIEMQDGQNGTPLVHFLPRLQCQVQLGHAGTM